MMISPVVTLKEKESVQSLIETLDTNKHNGFPVIRESDGQPASFIGLVLRSQLVVILRRRAFLADPSLLILG